MIASRVLAIYVGFHAVIYSGEVGRDLFNADVRASSLVPAALLVGLAGVLWFGAPMVARAMTKGVRDERPGPASARDLAHIAFAVAGLVIGAQALPLAAHVAARAASGDFTRDAFADLAAALARIGLGAGIVVLSRRAASALFGGDRR